MDDGITMVGVREYAEEYNVKLAVSDSGRPIIEAKNEGGYNWTQVDLLDLLEWLANNRPELIEDARVTAEYQARQRANNHD